MKITAQDEYGLRLLLRIARADNEEGLSIVQLSEAEALSNSYVAKLTRSLRLAGLIQSTRGQKGGYVLARPAEEITINEIFKAMDGALFDASFCNNHSGKNNICINSVDCSVRSLWRTIQSALDNLLDSLVLADLIGSEQETRPMLKQLLENYTKNPE